MDRRGSEETVVLAVVSVVAIVVAIGVAAMALMSRSMMGTMMGGSSSVGPGGWDLGVLVLAIAVAVAAIAFVLRTSRQPATPAPVAFAPPWTPPQEAQAPSEPRAEDQARLARFQEAAVVKALGEDERRLYLQIREGGGQALQRDLVASGAFSKAKVTRLLDKLERKGLVVRERFGATNRVRLTWKGPPAV